MKKLGFTLAEVLITLTIIGVVSALSAPALIANIHKNQIGPSLTRAVSNLSNANEFLFMKNDANKISQFANSVDEYTNELKKVMKISPLNNDANPAWNNGYSRYNGGVYGFYPMGAWVDGSGMIYHFDSVFTNVNNVPEPHTGHAIKLRIDINGNKKPNVLGKDLFVFYIDDNGDVIPFGGSEWNGYLGYNHSDDPAYDDDGDNCYVDDQNRVQIGTGETCAGYIADNGWKVLY